MCDVLNIYVLGGDTSKKSLKDEAVAGLTCNPISYTASEERLPDILWTKSLPTSEITSAGHSPMLANSAHAAVLYEDDGINLYDAITRDSSYYLYQEELSIFQRQCGEIVSLLP
jgi:hypothetical protein